MTDLAKAKHQLLSGDFTCVLCRGDTVRTSQFRGVRPLVRWYAEQEDFRGFSAADKVVGKAIAFLYVLLRVKSVYAPILSRSALEVFSANGIETEYGTLVENIINRAGDGICPFEQAVLSMENPQDAYAAIREKMAQMGIALQ